MSKKILSLMAILMIATLVLTACGTSGNNTAGNNTMDDTAGDDTSANADFKVCEVTDMGGVDDKSFNQLGWKGVQDAMSQLGVQGQYLESNQVSDYEVNINAFLDEGCDMIVTVGFMLADATQAAADANPDTTFAIIDVDWVTDPNVNGIMFQTDQAAFLAGYVAAASTKTGKVGTFGGMPIPSVTIFMDGFYMGVQYYNEMKGTSVEVVGWDPANPDTGLFTNDFESLENGRNYAITLADEGVDIIMPVAGPVGLGSAAAAQERGDFMIIGVDSDWTQTAPEYADVILTSVLKKVDVGVFNTIKSRVDDMFTPGTLVYTLADGALGLAGIDNFDSELQAEVNDLIEKINAGEIQTSPTPAE